jgi:hypothetical protein
MMEGGSRLDAPTWRKLSQNVRNDLKTAGFERWYQDPRNAEVGRLALLNVYSKMKSKDLWRFVKGPMPGEVKPGSLQFQVTSLNDLRQSLFKRTDFTNPTWSPFVWKANWESRSKDTITQLHLKNWQKDRLEAHIDPSGFVWRKPWTAFGHWSDSSGYTDVSRISSMLGSQGLASWATNAPTTPPLGRSKTLREQQSVTDSLSSGSLGSMAKGLNANPPYPSLSSVARRLNANPSYGSLSSMTKGLTASPSSGSLRYMATGLNASPPYGSPGSMARGLNVSPTYGSLSIIAQGLSARPYSGSLSSMAKGLSASPSSGSPSSMGRGLNASPSYGSLSSMARGLSASPSYGSLSSMGRGLSARPPSGSLNSMFRGPSASSVAHSMARPSTFARPGAAAHR